MSKLFIKKIQDTIASYSLFKAADLVIIGVSGGPDSIALVHILNGLRYRLGIGLHVAHVHHGLRREADAEENFVRELCRNLNLPLSIKRVKPRKNQTSLEDWGRQQRLKFFQQLSVKLNTNTIALGHHKNDVAETVLMRIFRGSGLSGLRAIRPVRVINDLRIVRPLWAATREEIIDYLKTIHADFCTDASNEDFRYLRNKIRKDLLPFLKKEYSPEIVDQLVNLSEILSADYEYLETQGRKCFSDLAIKTRLGFKFSLTRLASLPLSLRRMTIRMAVERIKQEGTLLSLEHVDAILLLIDGGQKTTKIALPYQLKAFRDGKHLYLLESTY